MKLKQLYEQGHWQVYKPHPGRLGGSGKTRSKQRISFLTKPSDREKFIHWGKTGQARSIGRT